MANPLIDNVLVERTRSEWNKFWAQRTPKSVPVADIPSEGDVLAFDFLLKNWSVYFHIDLQRDNKLRELSQMDIGDVAIQLDVTVEAATQFEDDGPTTDEYLLEPDSFKVMFPTNYATSKAKKIIEQVLKDTQIREQVPVIARDMLKFGDAFVEIVPDSLDDTIIRRLIHKPVKDMRVNRDQKGRLRRDADAKGTPLAYQQVTDGTQVVAGWYPEEILHWKLFPDTALSYSEKGMLDDHRDNWRKLTWIEQGMVVARVVRAYPRILHKLDVTGKSAQEAESTIKKYIRSITMKNQPDGSTRRTPMQVDEDYFIGVGYVTDSQGKSQPKLSGLEILDPKGDQIGNVTDIKYVRQKLTSRVPGEVIGVTDGTSQEITSQEIAYRKFIRKVQKRLALGIEELIDNALMRQGLQDIKYRIVFPTIVIGTSWKYADAQFRISMAERNDVEAGFTSVEQVLRDRGKSDDEIEKILQEIDDSKQKDQDREISLAKALAKIGAATSKAVATVGKNPKDVVTLTGTPGAVAATATGKAGNPGGGTGAPTGGNPNRRVGTATKATKKGLGQAAQGAKSGG